MLWLIEFAGCQFKRQAVEGLDLLFLAFRVFALFYLAFISWPTDHHTTKETTKELMPILFPIFEACCNTFFCTYIKCMKKL